jgi:ketosteroid isomerase-like protein
MKRGWVAFAVFAALLLACTREPSSSAEGSPDTQSDKRDIESLRDQELVAFNSGDVQGFIDIITDDVVFDSPNRPPAIGKDAIRSLSEAVFGRFDYHATYSPEELVIEGNWAFDRGLWIEKRTPKDGGNPTEVRFGILQLYQRQGDGSWKLARSIWNNKSTQVVEDQ